ncbi:MAG: hypothetical protein B6241_00565 [Spirochaetaceae bacterium 4572_59]|nr:MAG: hypothetical protein B6241_00565 [Spirochaetaceae bacterium 4572_59]
MKTSTLFRFDLEEQLFPDYNSLMEFTIDQSKCTRCGICMKECPPKTIRRNNETKEVRIFQENCIECSHCGMVCPEAAILVDGEPLPLIPDHKDLTDYEIADRLIRTKRSIRKYKSAPLLQEDLEEILKTGELTATASNSQQCEALVLQGGEVAAASAMMARELLKLTDLLRNPLFRLLTRKTSIARYTDPRKVNSFSHALKMALKGKADPLFFHAPALVILTYPKKGKRFGRSDCALAGAHMMLSAHARRLGSCMIGFAEIALRKKSTRKELGIPADRRIGLIFTLGYADQNYYRYPKRKHWDGFFS